MPEPVSASSQTTPSDAASYTVVARRYRPKSFDELVGQDHISQALGKAIATGRVGHAYLFTGARGVGKTSSARIFAKLLNTPEVESANAESDVARAIDAGDDIDVIEIDAASNRGIDEIRELRANVGQRPSRSRYKIYIIDEVHMLTSQAFNALLKTLEEPPPHVKFIFCTTDPEKVPITVLSRCQRFDFAPVRVEAIKQRLAEICESEGFQADDEALALLARRAAGSMRDSQSLLEQVMSFSTGKITSDQVHALLGTADESRMRDLAEALANRDGVSALQLVDKAISEGTDAGQFAEQMLGYLRDLMAVAVGGGVDLLKVCNPANFDSVKALADRWGLQSILAAVQLLDEALVRMRFSVQSQALFEVALVQISQLQDLATIAKIIEAVQHGGSLPAPAAPRATAPHSAAPHSAAPHSAAGTPEKKNVEGLNLPTRLGDKHAAATAGADAAAAATAFASAASTAATSNASVSAGADAGSPHAAHPQPPTAPHRVVAERTAPPATLAPAPTASAPTASASRGPVASSTAAGQPSLSSAPTIAIHAAPRPIENPSAAGSSAALSPAAQTPEAKSALASWKSAAAMIDGMLGDFAGTAVAIEVRSADNWVVVFPPGSAKPVEYCESPARKAELQEQLNRATGREVQFGFRVLPGAPVRTTTEQPISPAVARSQRMRELSEHPLVSKLCELLQGEVVRVDPPKSDPQATRPPAGSSATNPSDATARASGGLSPAEMN